MITLKKVIHKLSILLASIAHFTAHRVQPQRAMIYIPVESTRAYFSVRKERR